MAATSDGKGRLTIDGVEVQFTDWKVEYEVKHACAIYFETPHEPGLLPLYYSGKPVLAPVAGDEVCRNILRGWSRRPWRDDYAGPLSDRIEELGHAETAEVVRKHASAKGWHEPVMVGISTGFRTGSATWTVPPGMTAAIRTLPLNRSRRWVRRQVEQWTRNLTELFGDFGMAKAFRRRPPSIAAFHQEHADRYRAALAEHTQAILQGLLAPATITFGGTYEDPPIPF